MYRSLITRLPERPVAAPPLLFVHGLWHGAWCWDEYVLPWFAGQGFAAHALDLRGHGASDNDRSLRFTRVTHHIEDLASVVADFSDPPILIGHSMGGLVVQRYLEEHDAAGAVLVAPVPVRGALGVTLRTLQRHPLAFLKANLRLRLGPVVGTPALARDHLFGWEMPDAETGRHYLRLQDASYLTYMDMIFRPPRPHRVDTPILVIGAGHDGLFTSAEMDATARAYGTELVTIEGAPHDIMLDARWREMAETIRDWVAALTLP